MKKTIIALLVLSGIAAGGETVTKDEASALLINKGSKEGWLTNGVSIKSNSDGSSTLTGVFATKDGSKSITTVALTIDVSQLSTPTANTPFIILDGSTADIGIGLKSDGKLSSYWDFNSGADYSHITSSASFTPGTKGSLTLIFSMATNGTTLHYINPGPTSYTNGNMNTNDNLYGNLGTVTTLTLSSTATKAITKMAIWNDVGAKRDNDLARSAFNVVSTMTTVPEPTTATLSLLALAGLAARRRRK